MSDEKTLDITDTKDLSRKVSDVQVFGDPDTWQLICKASSKSQGWMKSTKAMLIPGVGVLVQVSTQQGDHVAEALCLVRGAGICTMLNGQLHLVGGRNLDTNNV